MKKIFYLVLGVAALASCQHDVVYEVDYNVTLDKDNTYFVGEPVKFNFTGEVDNIVFYSGEIGSQYMYRERYEVSAAEIESVALELNLEGQWGFSGGLDIYYTNTFNGLNGSDQDSDRKILNDMLLADMADWEKIEWPEKESKVEVSLKESIPLEKYENLSLAFYWHPVFSASSAQRTYLVSGKFLLGMKGLSDPLAVSFSSLKFTTVMMNEQIKDAYMTNNGAGSVLFDRKTTFTNSKAPADIVFKGPSAGFEYGVQGWVVATLPKVENVPVDPDRGEAIKNLQNYLHSYEYTWTKPGTYKVTFVGRNENYASSSEEVIEYTITILEKPVE